MFHLFQVDNDNANDKDNDKDNNNGIVITNDNGNPNDNGNDNTIGNTDWHMWLKLMSEYLSKDRSCLCNMGMDRHGLLSKLKETCT